MNIKQNNSNKKQYHRTSNTKSTHSNNSKQSKPHSNKIATTSQPSTSDNNAPRINKAIAGSGFCSRRKADELIFAGKVEVNGQIELNPARRLLPNDTLSINGQNLNWAQEKKYYLLLNKPIHTVSTVSDPDGRPTVLSLLPPEFENIRLFPVGRLDYFSEGLLILTNDGDLTNLLIHPRYHLPKVYHVTIRGDVPPQYLDMMHDGMELQDGEKLQPMQVTAEKKENNQTLLSITLYQGINRQIRRVCSTLNLTILRLIRISEGPLQLGNLPSGKIRALTAKEINALKSACLERRKKISSPTH